MNKVKIGARWVGEGQPVLVIAEAGINHNGELDKAVALVDAAAAAGADVIKFQTHLPDHEMLREGFSAGYIGESFFDLLSRCALDREAHRTLMRRAEEQGILFLSTPFSREAADLLAGLRVAAYKTGSGELTNIPLLSHIARKGKPMIISTGMSELGEIAATVRAVRRINPRLILMQCTSTYPAKPDQVNLGVIPILRKRFGCPVGLSDHTEGIATALGAVALGACAVEKHFTIDRRWPGPDQPASLDPAELAALVAGVRAVRLALGATKRVHAGEVPVQKMARESVVAVADIAKGQKIGPAQVWVKRPGTGIPARELPRVIGRVARRDIARDTLLRWQDLR